MQHFFHYFLAFLPWSIQEQDTFQYDLQVRYIKLATKAYPKNPKGGDEERYKELKKVYTMLSVRKLHEASDAGFLKRPFV